MLKEDTNLLITNKWKKQCVHDFLANQKRFPLRASTNLWSSGLTTLKKGGGYVKELCYCTDLNNAVLF